MRLETLSDLAPDIQHPPLPPNSPRRATPVIVHLHLLNPSNSIPMERSTRRDSGPWGDAVGLAVAALVRMEPLRCYL